MSYQNFFATNTKTAIFNFHNKVTTDLPLCTVVICAVIKIMKCI